MNVRLYLWQRLTAALMLPLLLVHLAVIFYAMRKGFSAADILSRTRGSIAWAAVLRRIRGCGSRARADRPAHRAGRVDARLAPRWRDLVAIAFGFLLVVLGLRAVAAVVLA